MNRRKCEQRTLEVNIALEKYGVSLKLGARLWLHTQFSNYLNLLAAMIGKSTAYHDIGRFTTTPKVKGLCTNTRTVDRSFTYLLYVWPETTNILRRPIIRKIT